MALLCLVFQVAAPWRYAEAQPPGRPDAGRPVFTLRDVGTRVDDSVRLAREALSRLRDAAAVEALSGAAAVGRGADLLERTFQPLEEIDREILDGYRRLAQHLRVAGLPATTQARNNAAEKAYRDSFHELRREVRETLRLAREQQREAELGHVAAAAQRRGEVRSRAAAADQHLAAMVARPEPVPFDPRNLPHRVAQPQGREPRMSPEDFDDLFAPTGASPAGAVRGQAKVLGFDAKAWTPGPEDLAETIEVQFTPEITALGGELGGDPLAIFDFVRNEIGFTPTFGSIQGATSCLRSRLCNAFDTASLLIALYRSSGIPARYAMGTVEVPIEEVKGLVGGFTDARAALNFMASSGTPVVGVGSGIGAPTAARFEHVWVEAFLDYVPSRGVNNAEGDTWVPLDPSFKQTEVVAGLDPIAALGADVEGFLEGIFDGAIIDPDAGSIQGIDSAAIRANFAELQGQLGTLLELPGAPTTTVGILGGGVVVPGSLPLLPGALPFKVLVRASQFADMPSSLRHQLAFSVASTPLAILPELEFQASLPELAGHRITLSYAPATEADLATMESFLPEGEDISLLDLPTSLPAFLIQVRPELRVEGELVAAGSAVTLGQSGRFRMAFTGPGIGRRNIDNAIVAASYNAIVLNLGRMESPGSRQQQAQALLAKVQTGDLSGLTRHDFLGELLHNAGILYWFEVESVEQAAAGSEGVVHSRLPSESIFSFVPKVELFFGAPRTVSGGGLFTDIDANLLALGSRDGDRERQLKFSLLTGAFGSRAESAIWDQLFNETPHGAGINAISYLEAASDQGITIFGVDQTNLASVLPQLDVSAAVQEDIRNAVNAGLVATVPQRAFSLDGFTGIGFVLFDPDTGSAAYLIDSGLAGGGFCLGSLCLDEACTQFVQGMLFSFSVSLASASTLPALAATGALISAVAAVVAMAAAFVEAAIRIRNNPDLSAADKFLIIGNALVQKYLTIGFLVAGSKVEAGKVVISLALDVAGALSGVSLDLAFDFFIDDAPRPVPCAPQLVSSSLPAVGETILGIVG